MDALSTLVRKSQLDSILQSFLPVGKQTDGAVIAHFEAHDLQRVCDLYVKRQQSSQKETFVQRVNELVSSESTSEEVHYLKKDQSYDSALNVKDEIGHRSIESGGQGEQSSGRGCHQDGLGWFHESG